MKITRLFLILFCFSWMNVCFGAQTVFNDPSAAACSDLAPANTGNGTCTIGTVHGYAKSETITFTATTSGPTATFTASGSLSGPLTGTTTFKSGASRTLYNAAGNPVVTLTLSDGGTPYVSGDNFTVVTTRGTELKKANFDLLTLDQVCLNGCSSTTELAQNAASTTTAGPTLKLDSTDTNIAANEYVGKIDFYSRDTSGSGAGVRASIIGVSADTSANTGFDFQVGNTAALISAMTISSTGTVNLPNIAQLLDSSGPNLKFNGTTGETSFVYNAVNDGTTSISGGSGSGAGRNTIYYGGTHATKANILEWRSGSTINGSITSAGLWTIGTSGDTSTDHQVNGELNLAGRFSNSGSMGGSGMFKLNGNVLTGVSQYAIDATTFTGSSAATTVIGGFNSLPNTSAAAYTAGRVIGYEFQLTTKGAGSTIDRHIAFGGAQPNLGTANAFLTDTVGSGLTGSWFLFQAGTSPSKFTGPISTPKSDVATTATIAALSSASSLIRLTGSTTTTVQGITAGVDGQWISIHNVSSAFITLSHEHASATAANRMTMPSAKDSILPPNKVARFVYDSGSTRWVTDYDYEEGTMAANFNQNAGASGSNLTATIGYIRVGKTVTLNFPDKSNITIGTTSSSLSTAAALLPTSIRPTADTVFWTHRPVVSGAAQNLPGLLSVGADGSLNVRRDSGTNWVATTTNCGWQPFGVSYTTQ